jgi:hypothetical protein
MSISANLRFRLTRLEQRHGRTELPKFILLCTSDSTNSDSLAPGERIVTDWITDIDGYVVGTKRITEDPDDHGRRCDPVVTWSRGISWID